MSGGGGGGSLSGGFVWFEFCSKTISFPPEAWESLEMVTVPDRLAFSGSRLTDPDPATVLKIAQLIKKAKSTIGIALKWYFGFRSNFLDIGFS